MACADMENFIDKFKVFTAKPTKFLTVQTDLKDDVKNLVKSLYDYTKTQEKVDKTVKKSALTELIVQDFDEEQIWQQIELQNSECWDQLVWEVANCISTKTDLKFPVTIVDNNTNGIEESGDESSMSEGEQPDSEQETKNKVKKPKKNTSLPSKSKGKPSIVDDQFFKLQELEKFLIHEEKKGGKPGSDSEESINMFEDIDDEDSEDEEGGKEAMYNDFFSQDGEEGDEHSEKHNDDEDEDVENEEVEEEEEDNDQQESEEVEENDDSEESEQEMPKKNDKKVRFAEENESSDDDSNDLDAGQVAKSNKEVDEKKSEFEMRQERLKKQIEKLEEKTLSDAPWQLKGEVDALKRPQNSLLEEVVDFDLTSRPAPIITEQTTFTLEDIIMHRIKDKAWDDVEKKERPVDTDQLAFRKPEVLDYAKSKQSLAQIYETEYLKQKQAASGEVEEEKEPEAHTEIREAMSKLFAKLDALSHYHYTPKAPQAEVKIVSNIPAISMEEVAPVATSDAVLLAPEEIKRKRKGELMSKNERTQTDKNRERRRKKKLQKAKGQVEKVTAHRNTQKGLQTDDKSLKNSKAFFQQLNDDTTSAIKKKNLVKNKGQ